MILYLLRHGIAEDAREGLADEGRRLTPAGRAKMRAAARGMRAFGIDLDALLTSPLVRARETADIVAEAYGDVVREELAALRAGVAPAETVRALRPFARRAHLAIVGHEPGLSGVASLLLTGSPDALAMQLKKGGLVAIELRDLPPRGDAMLRWMLTPRQLRHLGR